MIVLHTRERWCPVVGQTALTVENVIRLCYVRHGDLHSFVWISNQLVRIPTLARELGASLQDPFTLFLAGLRICIVLSSCGRHHRGRLLEQILEDHQCFRFPVRTIEAAVLFNSRPSSVLEIRWFSMNVCIYVCDRKSIACVSPFVRQRCPSTEEGESCCNANITF